MSKEKATLAALQAQLERLEAAPDRFDQVERAVRAESARELCHQAYALYGRRKDKKQEGELWKKAAALWYRATDEAYPPDFWENFERLKEGDLSGLETAVTFLEIDPWFFRSGYVKADLLRFIFRIEIPSLYSIRLQKIVLNAINLRDRREFRHYCGLAKIIDTSTFRSELKKLLESDDPGKRRRAQWVIDFIES